jgi:hypothetical protein
MTAAPIPDPLDPPIAFDVALASLAELGARGTRHVNGDLLAHLRGTGDMLQAWGAPHALCLAGLYHAVYGTAGFDDALLPLARRADVAAVIGPLAEALVYLFAACDRADFYPRLARREAPVRMRDRFTGTDLALDAPALAGLCELTLANELDIALHGDGAVRESQAHRVAALLPVLAPHARPGVARLCTAQLAELPGIPVRLSPAGSS